jgi:hypothetical protein
LSDYDFFQGENMEWWGYLIVAGSIISQGLAWAAKLRWSAEYKNAKEAQVKLLEEQVKSVKDSKDAHIAMLEKEIQNLRELTPMKLREYQVTTKQTLEEYNNSLQKKIEEVREEKAAFERQIQRETDQIVSVLKEDTAVWERFTETTRRNTAAIRSSLENKASASVPSEGQ